MFFAQLGPQFLDEPHRDVLARMEAAYVEAITIMESFWAQGNIDLRFEMGDQTFWNDIYYGNVNIHRRHQFTYNRIRPIINMISGQQRRTRKSMIAVPMENADNRTAAQFTKTLMWCANQDNMLETISKAFRGSCITGMNLLQISLDFREDPINGTPRLTNRSYNEFIIDPYFRKLDMSDCNFLWIRSWLQKREAISLLPESEDIIMGMVGQDNNRDGKFQFTPESYNYGMKNLLTYDEYYYRDYRTRKTLVDTNTGDTHEWRGKDEDLRRFLQTYPQINVITNDCPTVRLAIVVQGRVLYDGPNPLGIDDYPFVPVVSYYTPESPDYSYRYGSVVRSMRDAQYLYNRRKAIELDILESQVNSGWIYKEDSLVNPKDVYLSGQGRGVALKQEAQMTDVQRIEAPGVPASMIELSKILADELTKVSGVNEELLGSANDDKAGVLSMLRQGAGLTTLQILFDQLDESQRILGKVLLNIIKSNFTPGKIEKILQEQPAPEFYNKAFGKYDILIEDGLNTQTQKQMQFAQLLEMRGLGINIPDDILIDSATIQNKDKIIEAMQREKQQQMQQAQQQFGVALQQQQAQTDLAKARAVADRGLGLERVSRVAENQALAEERKAQAEKDHQMGLLNIVKALKEVDDVDLHHLEKLFTLSQAIKEREASTNEVPPSPSPEKTERASAQPV